MKAIPTLPSREVLKAHARRLRTTLTETGTPLSHAKALEAIARQWGYRDWNTISAVAPVAPAPHWHLGQKISGVYLGHRFTGQIKSISQRGESFTRLSLVFDDPIDVVTSTRFSALRRQVNATVNTDGCTIEKTSDGQPHLILGLN